MEYISPLRNKRRPGGDLEDGGARQAKRLCNGVGVCIQVEHGVVVTDSAMETWDASIQQQSVPNSNTGVCFNQPASNMVYAVQGRQCCNRCLAGEPGHINHIMGY